MDIISKKDTAKIDSGPLLAKVVSHLDPTYMGRLEVELLRNAGNSPVGITERNIAGTLHQVKMISPFYGVTGVDYAKTDPNDYNNTQKSYGMWFVPPDVGTTVIVVFIDGDPKQGYWLGCVADHAMNFMVPGYAATEAVVNGKSGERVPVAEYNKKVNITETNTTRIKKPRHLFADVLTVQGLVKDDIRGITSSSARREVPSAVFGISTPGPIDKRSTALTGLVGKKEFAVNTFVSRLGGSSFVMDDGDDKYLRKTAANQGPPIYTKVSTGTGGNPVIPHNELIRIRTRTGHQILLHNSEDLIYICNSSGSTWIELTSNGKIDIYAQDSISIHTQNDFNLTADRDINLTAGRNLNINTGGNTLMSTGGNYELMANGSSNISTKAAINLAAGSGIVSHSSVISMNSKKPKTATAAPKAARVPQHEPWSEHENLDPASFVPSKTVAATDKKPITPEMYQKYTTQVDTFRQV